MRKLILPTILALTLMAPTSFAQKPARLDSLRNDLKRAIQLSPDDTTLTWAINTAIQEVCTDFDAYARLDTITIREDSVGVALNSDFLRINWVMKRISDSIWVPMGPILGDTIYREVVIDDDAELKKRAKLQPQLYFWHDKLYTHPKYAKDSLAQTFIVAYWAADRHISSSDSSTFVRPNFLNAVVEYAAYVIHRSRSNFNNMAIWLTKYDKRLGR